MRRAACIFLAAVLLPCLVLAWLAVRSEQDQQVILQHQQAIIDQGVADALAQNVRTQMDGVIADFVHASNDLLTTASSPEQLAEDFHPKIRATWPLAQVGFAVDLRGTIYAPRATDGPPAQTFRKENESFLSNQENAEVYSNVQNVLEDTSPVIIVTPASSAAITSQHLMNAMPLLPANAIPADLNANFRNAQTIPANTSAEPVAMAGAVMNKSVEQRPTQKKQLESDYQRLTSATAAAPAAPPSADASAPAQDSQTISPAPTLRAEARAVHALTTTSSVTEAPTAPVPPSGAATDAVAETAPAAAPAPAIPSVNAANFALPPVQASQQQFARITRQVAPQENTRTPEAQLSNVLPAQSDFRQLIGQSTSGSVARFLEDKLCVLVWSLPSHHTIVFGAQLNQDRLVEKLLPLVRPDANRSALDSSFGARADYCLALLDDKGHPVALSQKGFTTDWKHPFVATEIGGVLPHWEAALYLTDPQQVSHSARVLHFTVGLIIALLVVAILAGGTLIAADVNRQMRLAQQKTDFVSNVSHELKTPLTSIRMFADMLAEGRVEEPEKQATYLRIISAESARLTRLINNVLDFARQERGAPAGEQHPCDLVDVARDVAATCQPHLESTGVTLQLEIETESLPLLGDRDALSQIILNLISNAEKYGGGEIVVRARRQEITTGAMGCVDVLDRGPGIPPRQVEAIFTAFKRLDDSLASGVPGSGLGLTLARRMARAHGGDVTYQPRAGGGSCFTIALPLLPKKSSA